MRPAVDPNGAYQRFLETHSFGSLDGLRCLSIVLVLIHHAGAAIDGLHILRTGYLGVDLFFAISGFLITTLLLREMERSGRISLRKFYARRSLRIFPLYYAVLGFYVAAVALFERDAKVASEFYRNLPYFATYTSNWFVELDQSRVIFYFSWSLATEEQFYLALPPILAYFGRKAALTVALGLLGLRAVYSLGWTDELMVPGTFPARVVASIMPSLVMGVLSAFVLASPGGHAIVRRLLGWRFASSVLLVLVLVAMELGWTGMWIMHPLMAGLVVSVVVREDHVLAGLLRWRPVAAVGIVSYGIYLLHMPIRQVVMKVAPDLEGASPVGFFLAVCIGSYVAAYVSFRWFEGWFLQFRSRFRH